MATNKMLQVYGTQLLFANHDDDFGAAPATAGNSLIIGTPTDVQIDLTDVAAAAAWQSAKTLTLAHTGTAYPIDYILGACIEHVATPTAGEVVDFYWNGSPSATAAVANSGAASGADETYAVAGLPQLIFIGSLTLRAATINIDACVGILRMPYLYGSLIVHNVCPTKALHSAMDETHFTLTPVILDAQASA